MSGVVRRAFHWASALALVAACGPSAPTPGGPCTVSKDCVTGEICVGGACQVRIELRLLRNVAEALPMGDKIMLHRLAAV